MASVIDHYEDHLSDSYSWLHGGLQSGVSQNRAFLETHSLAPRSSGIAVDLGSGSGFQSIPLAQLGYSVTAIDQSEKLLNELRTNSQGLQISTFKDDLVNFRRYCAVNVELCICMGDTLTHLDSQSKIQNLFNEVYFSLEKGGRFILSFRNLMQELKELDRFIPVQNDGNKIFTCFLEYEDEAVKVHDLVYERIGDGWNLKKSFYRKIRVPYNWTVDTLMEIGFDIGFFDLNRGLVTIIADKK